MRCSASSSRPCRSSSIAGRSGAGQGPAGADRGRRRGRGARPGADRAAPPMADAGPGRRDRRRGGGDRHGRAEPGAAGRRPTSRSSPSPCRRTGGPPGSPAAAPRRCCYLASALFSDNGLGRAGDVRPARVDRSWPSRSATRLRNRRAYVAAIEERARRAEQSRDEEARRRVVEERLRIARELHDVVAHHIAMINVQAGVAAHVLRQQPEQAEEALGPRPAGGPHGARRDLHAARRAARATDDPDRVRSRPAGLGRLGGLLDSLAAAGLQVEHRQDGDGPGAAVGGRPGRLPDRAGVADQRPEARRRSGRLDCSWRTPRTGLRISIANSVGRAATTADGTGHGLVGMRERAACGGRHAATTGPTTTAGSWCRPSCPQSGGTRVTIRVLLADDQALIRAGLPGADRHRARPGGGRRGDHRAGGGRAGPQRRAPTWC